MLKKFGQHFLKNRYYINKIISSIEIIPPANILEIGPGMGSITFPLIEKGYNLICIEIDQRFEEFLKGKNLFVYYKDALHFPEKIDVFLNENNISVLVSNLPYGSGTKIFLRYLKYIKCLKQMLLMFQKEVGEKILAESNSSLYGALSVITKTMAESKIISKVPPSAFSPKPEVDSILISFKPKEKLNIFYDDFLKFLSNCFRKPRKTLYNNLIEFHKRNIIKNMYLKFGFEMNIRPHQVSPEEFLEIFNFLEGIK